MTNTLTLPRGKKESPKPELSIIMPTYNDSKYISNAMYSVLDQDFENWELIIVDGSTDDTPNIVKSFTDNRIVYLRESSSGQLNALLTGVEHICYYLAF
jgi:glycosyltransferase involved in cell wall biosynthesis